MKSLNPKPLTNWPQGAICLPSTSQVGDRIFIFRALWCLHLQIHNVPSQFFQVNLDTDYQVLLVRSEVFPTCKTAHSNGKNDFRGNRQTVEVWRAVPLSQIKIVSWEKFKKWLLLKTRSRWPKEKIQSP
jgi:hypothetical protein